MILQFFLALYLSISNTEDEAAKVFKDIWSPYCKGVSLLECPSGQAEDLRDQIRARIKNGETPEQILGSLYEHYGDKLRMAPNLEGRESLAYYAPYIFFVFVLIGLAILWTNRFRRPRSLATPQKKDSSAVDPRILQDLKDRLQ